MLTNYRISNYCYPNKNNSDLQFKYYKQKVNLRAMNRVCLTHSLAITLRCGFHFYGYFFRITKIQWTLQIEKCLCNRNIFATFCYWRRNRKWLFCVSCNGIVRKITVSMKFCFHLTTKLQWNLKESLFFISPIHILAFVI